MSLEEDQDLLKAVREWRPPKELHPISMHVFHMYEKSGDSLPPEKIHEIREILNSYGDDLIALAEALEGISRFVMLTNEHLNDPKTSEAVADLMREYTHLFEPFWERVGEALSNVGEDQRSAFQAFMALDQKETKDAPKYGEKPPVDSVPLKDLTPQGRPPPWAKKK